MKDKKAIIRTIVIIAIIAVGIIWVCSHFFHLGNVEWTDNAQVRRNIVPINSRVQGYIERICFNDFEEVHKGDTLVVIENSEHLLRVAQANELKVRLVQAEKDYNRYEQLLEQKAVTRQQYEDVKTNYDALKAKYDMLVRQKNSTRLVKIEQTQRLEQRQADVEAAKAALDMAQLNLSYTVVTAPCDGIASKKNIQIGQLIQPGQNLLSLVESDNVWVVANYKETQMKNIKDGMKVKIKVDAVPDITYSGVVTSISYATGAQYSAIPVDNATGNFVKVKQRVPVRIDFSDDNSSENLSRLSSGMNVECEVIY